MSSQLPVVFLALLVDPLESVDLLLGLSELLSILCHLLMYSGGKPKGHGTDGSIERWIEGEDDLS